MTRRRPQPADLGERDTATGTGLGEKLQQVILRGHEGHADDEAVAWDIRAEAHIAAFILRHLATDPPPALARTAEDFRRWATNLQRDAQARQEALGRPALLRAV
jgi:hypothetical protein